MQQELLSDAPSLKAVRMKKRQRPESAQLTLEHRLSMVSGGLAARFLGRIALAQVWTLCHEEQSSQTSKSCAIFRTQRIGAAVSDPGLAHFRQDCCDAGVAQNLAGMLATTWSGGALAIVQKLNVMPSSLHPCNKLLAAGVADTVSELAYIPVYDQRQPTGSVIACLEVMVSAAADSTFLPNVITTAADLLAGYQLALCKPSAMTQPAASPHPVAAAAAPAYISSEKACPAAGYPAAGGGCPPLAPASSGSSVDSCPAPGTPDTSPPRFSRPSMVRVGTRRSLDLPPQHMELS